MNYIDHFVTFPVKVLSICIPWSHFCYRKWYFKKFSLMHSHGSEFQRYQRGVCVYVFVCKSLPSTPELVPSFASFVCILPRNILHKQICMSILSFSFTNVIKIIKKKNLFIKGTTTYCSIPCSFSLKNILEIIPY